MGRWEIRTLRSEDFAPLMRLEEEVFGASGEKTLGPYYVRLCCEFFVDTCFIAFADGEPAAFLGQQVGDNAQAAERLGGPFDVSLGPCRHRDSYSLRRERMRDAETDPFRARGHESDLAVDAQVHVRNVFSSRG